MKGAFLASSSSQLFEVAARVLVGMGGVSLDGVAQIRDELGNLFTVFEDPGPSYDYRDGPLIGAPGVQVPNLNDAVGVAVECRDERTFAMIAGLIAQAIDAPVWVIDGDGVVWSALTVDSARVRL